MVARKNYRKLHIAIHSVATGRKYCWLDNGEGDEFVPLWRDGKVGWIENPSPLATRKRKKIRALFRKGTMTIN